jgi:hypothetical protein
MMTWFDALLVTVLAAVVALAARRGLAGGLWGVGAALIVLVVYFISSGVAASVVALVLGVIVAFAAQRAVFSVVPQPWHMLVGGVGGAGVGLLVVGALALSFPVKVIGSQGTYPSDELPPAVYYAVVNSFVVRQFTPVWGSGELTRHLWLPDQE